ncbi:MAG: histidine kinase [Saprospiraceae bacterium]|nr:histidine kinase [Saprospiraceae bacterium]
MYRFLIIICFLGFASSVAAQQPYFKNYQVRDGLPSNQVYFIHQDSKGYVWLCTDLGVSRFDGARFTNFTTADGLSDNEVFSCFEDKSGRLWFATLNGKPCFFQDEKIHSELDLPLLKDFSLGGLIISIFQEETGEIVMASASKIGWLNLDKRLKKLEMTSVATTQLWPLPGSALGILSSKKLGEYENGQFRHQLSFDGVKLPVKYDISGDTLFLSFLRKLIIFNLKSKQLIQEVQLPPEVYEAISVHVSAKWVWVGDRKGVYCFNRQSLALENTYLPNRQVSSILEDREAGWWFSTLDNGIFYVPSPEIIQYSKQDASGQTYKVGCLSKAPNGQLWLGMNKGAYGILIGDSLSIKMEFPSKLAQRAVNSIHHHTDGSTWLAGKAGILRIKEKQKQFYRIRSSDVKIDEAGNLWSGLTGLYFISEKDLSKYLLTEKEVEENKEPEYYLAKPPQRLAEIRVDKIAFDESKTTWLASSIGLFNYKNGKLSKPLLPYPTRDVLFDKTTNLLWALTETNGLYVLRNGVIADSIAITNGQQPAICRGICTDENGTHWLATAKGLYKVDGSPGKLSLINYTNNFGVGTQKLNGVEVANDLAYLGTDEGLMVAPIAIFSQKIPPPPIFIKRLEINNLAHFQLDTFLQLSYSENSLTFQFEGLSFKDFKHLSYQYRLIGHETAWHLTPHEAVEYASLRPGNYRFEVRAINSSVVASEAPASFSFSISTPFWLKGWFWLGLLACAGGLVWFWIKKRERKLLRKYEIQQQLMEAEHEKLELQKKYADLKMLALRLQMNPHFIFNALNTLKGYYGQAKITQANSYIAKFARLLRLNLDYSDTFIPLEQELELIKIYVQLSQIRYPDKIEYEVTLSPNIVASAMLIPSMVMQPFVENAILHGIVPKPTLGTIQIEFSLAENGELLAVIRDNGIGRLASAAKPKLQDPHKPLAINITMERLQLLRKTNTNSPIEIIDLKDGNGDALGTEVRLWLPMEPIPRN